MIWLFAAFLIAHGATHMAIWLPPAPTDAERRAPFAPDHSAVLSKTQVSQPTTRLAAVELAAATTIAYVVAGLAVGLGAGWATAAMAVAAALGLVLKVIFFNPWLTLGVLLDLAVLGVALFDWPGILA